MERIQEMFIVSGFPFHTWKARMGDARVKERSQIERLMIATLERDIRVGRPVVTWVMENQRSTAMAVIVPEETRMLVPCIQGTSLQATRPRNHLPP